MTAYEALTAAYRDRARITGDASDAGLESLFDEIAIFAESDAGQVSATAHELEFLAGVLLLAARKVTGDDGASQGCPPAPGSPTSPGDAGQKPLAPALAPDLQNDKLLRSENDLLCRECGAETFVSDAGTTHHVGRGWDGIDHARDRDHTALPEREP